MLLPSHAKMLQPAVPVERQAQSMQYCCNIVAPIGAADYEAEPIVTIFLKSGFLHADHIMLSYALLIFKSCWRHWLHCGLLLLKATCLNTWTSDTVLLHATFHAKSSSSLWSQSGIAAIFYLSVIATLLDMVKSKPSCAPCYQ